MQPAQILCVAQTVSSVDAARILVTHFFFMVNGYCFKDGAILSRTNLLLPPIEINKAYHSTPTTTAH